MGTIIAVFYKIAAFILALIYTIGLPVKLHGRPLSGSVTITAHSGCLDLADNSIEAMEAGIDAGAQIVEFDLNYTADGTPVLSHDTPNEEGNCVTLEEAFAFLAEHPGVFANVDVKSTTWLEKVPVLAEQAGVLERIFFTGVIEDYVEAVKEKCPGIPYYLNAGISEDEDLAALARKTADLGAVGLNINWNDASPELIRIFHKNGLPVSVWTVNEGKNVIKMAVYGADNITTRRPDIAAGIIRQGRFW